MANMRTPREAWIQAALDVLEGGGPAAVRVESIAERLGVTKGGFYGHFRGRDQLLDEMLDRWERAAAATVIEAAEAGSGDGPERLAALVQAVRSRGALIGPELAIREWARRDESVAARVDRVDAARLNYLGTLFRDLGYNEHEATRRAASTVGVWLASHMMRFDHSGHSHDDVLRSVFDDVARPPPGALR